MPEYFSSTAYNLLSQKHENSIRASGTKFASCRREQPVHPRSTPPKHHSTLVAVGLATLVMSNHQGVNPSSTEPRSRGRRSTHTSKGPCKAPRVLCRGRVKMPHHPSHARKQGARASLGKLRGRGQWDGRQMQSPGSLGPASPVKALPSMLPRLQGGQLSSLSRGNLAHSARVTRSTKAAPCRLVISIVFVLAVSVSSSKSSSSSLPPCFFFVFSPVYRPLRSPR